MQLSPLPNQKDSFNRRSISRAMRSIRCLPFNMTFYSDSRERGMNASFVFANRRVYGIPGERWYKSANALEGEFRWMIKIGIMRREVDGQGLTSQIRITPLGRDVIDRYTCLTTQKPTLIELFVDWLRKHWPIYI